MGICVHNRSMGIFQYTTPLGSMSLRQNIPGDRPVIYALFYDLTFIRKKGVSSRNQKISLGIYTLTFILAKVSEVVRLMASARLVDALVLRHGSKHLTSLAWKAHNSLAYWANICFYVEMLINDGLLIWRAYTLSRCRRWILVLPGLMSLASLSLFLVVTVPHLWVNHHHVPFVAEILSFGANFVITCLIGRVYWTHKKDMKNFFNKANKQSKVGSVLVILVTTGVMLSVTRTIHPTLTIVLVNLENTFEEHSLIGASLQQIAFRDSLKSPDLMPPTFITAPIRRSNSESDLEST
ncbi:hypothetical protein BDZ94DRAFT_1238640 [Collybia nuda]|uniref:Uncharacterized protein n=1 Tax=Collybia nuda TaxID=64659 RepID=A0A9P5Y2Y3_9AGAR|nr:hypothetical protein BDZ94DRAFT_1238640 [Collybia nuda]